MRVIVSQDKGTVITVDNVSAVKIERSSEVEDIFNALTGNMDKVDYCIVANGSYVIGKFKKQELVKAEFRNIIDFIVGEDSFGRQILVDEYQVNQDIDGDSD